MLILIVNSFLMQTQWHKNVSVGEKHSKAKLNQRNTVKPTGTHTHTHKRKCLSVPLQIVAHYETKARHQKRLWHFLFQRLICRSCCQWPPPEAPKQKMANGITLIRHTKSQHCDSSLSFVHLASYMPGNRRSPPSLVWMDRQHRVSLGIKETEWALRCLEQGQRRREKGGGRWGVRRYCSIVRRCHHCWEPGGSYRCLDLAEVLTLCRLRWK